MFANRIEVSVTDLLILLCDMNAQPPPIPPLSPGLRPAPPSTTNLGRIGLQLSLMAPTVLLLFMVLRPG
jgi:hypothetical protein